MTKALWAALPLLASSFCLQAQSTNPFTGRWDVTMTSGTTTYPDWLEVVDQNGAMTGRIQPRGGAVHPVESIKRDGDRLLITASPAANNRPETTWELTAKGDAISGVQKNGEKVTAQIAGVRAPKLNRPMPKAWGKPESLFNGKDLTGWEPVSNPQNNHWVAKDGVLLNEDRGANIRTTKTFQDFQLHIEVLCPTEHCNSGIYLRGRYEVQVGTEGGTQPSHEMGAIYGYVPAAKEMPMGIGEWQTFDITFVGRTVTVKRNGVTIHDHVEIPGITGGALDANEAEPGPIFLQGDHTGGLQYRNITIATPKG